MTTNLEQSVSDNILKTIDILVDKKLDELEYNTTIKGQIVDASKAEKGIYTVKYETSTFIAYTTDTTLAEKDLVQVLISHNNSNDTRIILNKIVAHEDEYLVNTTFKNYIDVTGNLTDILLDANKSLLANGKVEEKLLWEYSGSKELTQYNYLKLEADFQTLLSNAIKGNFGLRLEIITNIDIINLYFTSNEMLGNAFNYTSYTKQKKLFDLTKTSIQQINGVSLYFYQETDSFYDINDNLLVSKDSLGNPLPANIFIDNINLSFGFSTNEYMPGIDVATISLEPEYKETFNESTGSIIANLSWIHWNEDNSGIIPHEEILKSNDYHIEWYYYQQYSDAVNTIRKQRQLNEGQFVLGFSNEYYDIVEQKLIDNIGCIYTDNKNWQRLSEYDDEFSCEFYPNADSNAEEQLKAFVISNNGDTVLESNILLLKNENTPNIIKTDNKTGIEFSFSDGLDGNYYLYTQSGILNNEDTKTRVLEVLYYNTEGELIDLIDNDNYTITWDDFPQYNTMFAMCEQGRKSTEVIYSIKEQYEPTAINNIIGCTITYNGEDSNYSEHKAVQQFNFGYSNISNANETLIIRFTDTLASTNNIYYTKNAVEEGSTEEHFRIDKYDSTGKLVDITNSEIEWALHIYSEELDENNNKVLTKHTYTIEDSDEEEFSINQIINKIKVTVKHGFNFNQIMFLEANVDGASITYPIPVSKNIVDYNHISGATSIIYKTLGVPVYNKKPYMVYDYNGSAKIEEDYIWQLIGDSWYELTEDNIINPPMSYIKNSDDNSIAIAYKKDDDIIWLQPINVLETQFSSTTLAQWNGASILQDDDNGTLAAPRIATGRKENDKFTGVVIGDWCQDDEDETSTGVYGFKEGESVYGLRDNGTAFLGADSGGRILFDGEKSTISSSSYISDQIGLFLDLDDAFIDASSENDIISEIDEDEQNDEPIEELVNNIDQYGVIREQNAQRKHILIDAKAEEYPLLIGPEGQEIFKIDWNGNGLFRGTINALSGTIGGWEITRNLLRKTFVTEEQQISEFLLSTVPGDDDITIKFGDNFLVTKDGTLELVNCNLSGNLSVQGSIDGFYKQECIIDEVKFYVPKNKWSTTFSYTYNLNINGYGDYIPVAISDINTGSAYIHIISQSLEYNDNGTVTVYIGLSKYPYTKKKAVAGYLSVSILMLKTDENDSTSISRSIHDDDGVSGGGGDEAGGNDGNSNISDIDLPSSGSTGITGVLGISYGGTGATTAAQARENLGIVNIFNGHSNSIRELQQEVDYLISDIKTLRSAIINNAIPNTHYQ